MSKSRNIADLGSNDVLETDANGVTVTGGVASDTLNVDSGTLFVDGANNRVGVGTTNPNGKLTVTDGNDGLEFGNEGITGTTRIFAYDRNAGSEIDLIQRASTHIFQTDNSEAARIDSGGNLLVGTTTINPSISATPGVNIFPLGQFNASRNDGQSLDLGRNNSDGEIVKFRKDGSIVGSISTFLSRMVLGTGNTQLNFFDATDSIRPASSSLTNRDAAIDLGDEAARFKELYLSGGVYLGGTGSANYLDDYEEGFFTPSIDGTNFSIVEGVYRKIGSVVYVFVNLSDGSSAATSRDIDGLPFTVTSQATFGSSGDYIGEVADAASEIDYYTRTINATNSIRILKRNGDGHTSVNSSEVPTRIIRVSITYITDD